MKASAIVIIVLVAGAAIVASASFYTVQEGQQVVVTQFGKPVAVITEAGLKFRLPFVQTVHRFEKRLLPWDGEPEHMQTRDKKRIFIDTWARWHIVDLLKFYQAVHTERRGYKILDDLVDSSVRDVVARYNLIEVVRSSNRELFYESEELAKAWAQPLEGITTGRVKMEEEILVAAGTDLAARYGMELIDVRVKRINYIESVRQAVYERMKSERMRIASLLESEAEEEENKILGLTRKELDQIEGEMKQKSSEIRGRADAEVIRIAAEAYGKSPEFYEFLRRLEAYKATLGRGTRLILSTDNEFLRALSGPGAGSAE